MWVTLNSGKDAKTQNQTITIISVHHRLKLGQSFNQWPKNTLYMSVNIEYLKTRLPPERLAIFLKGKIKALVPSFLSYFKTLSIGPVLEIESMTPHSVNHSADWGSPAVV